MEYNLGTRGNSGSCSSAENVKVIPKGSITLPEALGELLEGSVVRPLRSVNPDQNEYSGLIRIKNENTSEAIEEYEFGIMGLLNKRELLQVGDHVQFQVSNFFIKHVFFSEFIFYNIKEMATNNKSKHVKDTVN